MQAEIRLKEVEEKRKQHEEKLKIARSKFDEVLIQKKMVKTLLLAT